LAARDWSHIEAFIRYSKGKEPPIFQSPLSDNSSNDRNFRRRVLQIELAVGDDVREQGIVSLQVATATIFEISAPLRRVAAAKVRISPPRSAIAALPLQAGAGLDA